MSAHAILSAAETPAASYDGPFIDAVVQWTGPIKDLEEIVGHLRRARVDRAGISVSVLMDRSKAARRTKAVKEHSTGGRAALFFQGSPVYFKSPAALAPDFVDLFIAEMERERYAFVGEVMYRHADKRLGEVTPGGERYMDPLSPASMDLIARIGALRDNVPIFIHWEFYRWQEDRPRFAEFFKEFPKQTFIITHMGYGSPEQVRDILREHDNVFFTISKKLTPFGYFADPETKQGPAILDERKDVRAEWRDVFIEYPTRFLFATDSHKRYMWDNYEDIVREYALFFSQLPADVAHRIAHQNAEAVFKLEAGAGGKGAR